MAEEENINIHLNLETENDPNLLANDFCLLTEDDIEAEVNTQDISLSNISASSSAASRNELDVSSPVDVETIKRKAEVCVFDKKYSKNCG